MNEEKKPQVYITSEEPRTFNDPFANMNMEKDELKNQKRNSKIIITVFSVVVFLLLVYIFIDYVNDASKKNSSIPVAKENLDNVSLDLVNYIEEYHLDALDAYGMDDLLMVGINHVCYGVDECKSISSSVVGDYLKEIFGKEITMGDVQCSLNDGVLYSYNGGKFVYNEAHPKHDLPNTTPIYSKVNSIKKNDGKYVLTLNKLYYSEGKSEYITSDALGINKIYNFSDYDMPSDSGSVIDMTKLISDYNNDFDKLKNKGNRYQYVFSKKDKNYILEKYEVIDTSKW